MVEVNKVSKYFAGECVLQEVTCQFEDGKVYGVVGNNGSGKTVLFKCICGFLRPDKGIVKVEDKIVGKDVDFPPHIGLIIENLGFLAQIGRAHV